MFLSNSPPDTNGYAIRSHMLAKHQNKLDDIEVFGFLLLSILKKILWRRILR